MQSPSSFLLAADALLVLHTIIVVFVAAGLPLILLGGRFDWAWVRNWWFRLTHLLAIGIVVLQAWLGEICPLTIWEAELRMRGGDPGYDGSFIAYWLARLIYFDAPLWVFTLVYTVFGAAVVYAWLRIPPRRWSDRQPD